MEYSAQLAHRAEDLGPEHEDDEERREAHGSGRDAPGSERQRRGGAAGNRAVGDAAREDVGREHPHGALEEISRLVLELVGACLALAERLQGREALDRIQELGREGGIGLLPAERIGNIAAMPDSRRE